MKLIPIHIRRFIRRRVQTYSRRQRYLDFMIGELRYPMTNRERTLLMERIKQLAETIQWDNMKEEITQMIKQ